MDEVIDEFSPSQYSMMMEDDGSLVILRKVSSDTNCLEDLESHCNICSTDEVHEKMEKCVNDVSELPETCENGDYSSSGDPSLSELERLLTKEQENLERIKKSNELMKHITSYATSVIAPGKLVDNVDVGTMTDTVTVATSTGETQTENAVGPVEVAVKSCQKLLGKFSSNFRRRQQSNRPRKNNTPVNMQNFIQNYYRSLDSVSRYIILSSILSFFTAFCLLSCYSAQTHSHDMELFQMKEKRALASQEALETMQNEHKNFRETLIHQRYEESRECQSSLKTCHSKRDKLLAQISQQDKLSEDIQIKWHAELDIQRKENENLQLKLRQLLRENPALNKGTGQSIDDSDKQKQKSSKDNYEDLEAMIKGQRKEITALEVKLKWYREENNRLQNANKPSVIASVADLIAFFTNMSQNSQIFTTFMTGLAAFVLVLVFMLKFYLDTMESSQIKRSY